jgi:hypothetical protein
MIEIEKPAGAHPESIMVAAEGLLVAEYAGKKVARIGYSKINPFSRPGGPLVINDKLMTRQELLAMLKESSVPMEDKYKSLYSS